MNPYFFVTIPHAGEKVPELTPWLKSLPEPTLMRDVDRYVDVLYSSSIEMLKIPFVKTDWHRYAADLNRVPDDIDAGTVVGNSNAIGTFSRGFHWAHTTLKEQLMPHPMSLQTHQQLVDLIYRPFHQQVQEQYAFGFENGAVVYHLDLHSMPSVGTSEHRDPGQLRADVVISDCKGLSASKEFVDLVLVSYARAGLKVAYNWPYFGGRVSEQYGKPKLGQHAVQVELNRALYMDEDTKKLLPEKSQALQKKLEIALQLVMSGLANFSK